MITGRGMYLIADPTCEAPSATRITPAIIVHMKRPSLPYSAMMPATTTTNAPVGPPIAVSVPPSADVINPAMTAVYMPAWGGMPEAMANAIASGSATSPTVAPAIASDKNVWRS